jgi:hypothetical protein
MEGGVMTYNAIYKIESGAAKKRKREEEVEFWNSKNGPVILKRVEDGKK